MSNDKYDYNRFGSKAKRVGQAVYDILSKDQPSYTAEDILEEYSKKFVSEMEDCIQQNLNKFENPFYIFVLTKKENWATNVVRNWFIARQTSPRKIDMMSQYPHATKTVYKINKVAGDILLEWTLPGIEDCKSIVKNPHLYSAELVAWIKECFEGEDKGKLLVA